MQDTEIKQWMWRLAPTHKGRITIILDLLQHARGDRMTEEDRRICNRSLALLDRVDVPVLASLDESNEFWASEVYPGRTSILFSGNTD